MRLNDPTAPHSADELPPASPEAPDSDSPDPLESALAQIEQLAADGDTKGAERLRLQLAEERALESVRTHYAPAIEWIGKASQSELLKDLPDEAAAYLRNEVLPDIDPTVVAASPKLASLLRNAALGHVSQLGTAPPRAERIGGGAPELDLPPQEVQAFNAAFKDLGLTAEALAENL